LVERPSPSARVERYATECERDGRSLQKSGVIEMREGTRSGSVINAVSESGKRMSLPRESCDELRRRVEMVLSLLSRTPAIRVTNQEATYAAGYVDERTETAERRVLICRRRVAVTTRYTNGFTSVALRSHAPRYATP